MLSTKTITGLSAGEKLVAIDQRVVDGRTYALSSLSRLYRLDTTTGAATPVGPAVFSPALSGTEFDLEFTPLFGAGRVVGDGDQNLRINPVVGTVASVDQPLAYGATDPHFGADPGVVAAAYSDNALGASATTLYALDSSADTLVRIGSVGGSPDLPNGGVLTTIGPLGPDFGPHTGFDIDAFGVAFASLDLGTVSQLCKIDLSTGAVRDIGAIGGPGRVIDIAVETPAPPTLFGVDDTNQLVSFQAGAPAQLLSTRTITGLASGESIIALDFDPVTRDLLGVSDQDRVVRISTSTAVATALGPDPFTFAPPGTRLSIDVDPALDVLRVVSNGDGNITVSTHDGTSQTADQTLAYAAGDPGFGSDPNVVSIAYAMNHVGATAPALYGIDSTSDTLVQLGAVGGAASGQLTTIGALTVDVSDAVGFDVDAHGLAFASNNSFLYRVDIATGTLTVLGPIGGHALRDLTIQPR
jgi:hypothetical protein